MIGYFRENTSKIPGDNGSSLNITVTKIINTLNNITMIKTSVPVVFLPVYYGGFPLEPVFLNASRRCAAGKILLIF
jgi:hypothetical protein